MESEAAILALAALAQPTRLETFRLLARHEPDGLPAGEIADALAVPANTMSVSFTGPDRSGLCREGQTWRRTGNAIQVSNGCGGNFEALVRKMNRSAAFVVNDPHRRRGSRKALVEISINGDGTLKNYRVLRSGDQSEEIAYIKSVLDRASPFSAFPRDIRRAGDHISILMCILPARSGGSGGFARSFGDQDCRD